MKSTHKEIKDLLPEYLNNSLSNEVRNRIDTHLEECRECRVELSFISELRGAEDPDPGDLFWATLPQRVRSAIKEENSRRFTLRPLFFKGLAASAAVAALLFLVLTYTGTKKNVDITSDLFYDPYSAEVMDYSDLTAKDIPAISGNTADDDLSVYPQSAAEHSLYSEVASLNSGEIEGLCEALKNEQKAGG